MERETKKACFGFSWADEVEREEREEGLQNGGGGEKPDSKPNPFGAARPREVVLEEKGVDWRKLDQNLDYNYCSTFRNDNKPKKNNSSDGSSVSRADNFALMGSRCQKQRKQQQAQITSPIIPPLRYPPKNITTLMEQVRRGHSNNLGPGLDNQSMLARSIHYTENMGCSSRYKRKLPQEEMQADEMRRHVLADLNIKRKLPQEEMQAHERRCVLADLNMERRLKYICDDRSSIERTASGRNREDGPNGIEWEDVYRMYSARSNNGKSCLGGATSRDMRRKDAHVSSEQLLVSANNNKAKKGKGKGKLTASQPGPCQPRRQRKFSN